MECSNCGATVDRNKLFCPECEEPMHLSDTILPVQEKSPPPARKEEPKPDQGEIHRRTFKAWVIRILIMVLMVGILLVALILLANSRKSPATTGVRPQVLLVPRSMDTVKHRERRCAAPARRATESYFCSTSRERNAAGVDAAAFECQRIYGTGYPSPAHRRMPGTARIKAWLHSGLEYPFGGVRKVLG